ncbi:MAG TPA: hypothetical protein VHZ75_08610 [Solirubrobacteraceae bacterium]|jgi:hypothetical protein|nr:hypothetical protein [Solirubrobacteraceae bacterium]
MATAVQNPPTQDAPPDGGPLSATAVEVVRSPRVMLLIALSGAAAVVDARAMFNNASHALLFAILYGLLSYAQVMWAGWLYHDPQDTRVLRPAAIASVALIGIWLVTRFVGLPVGPSAGEPSPIGIPDFVAMLDEAVLALLLFAMLAPKRRIGRRLAWLNGMQATRVSVMLCSLSGFAALLSPQLHVSASGIVSWCIG